MTDKEIVKALECHKSASLDDCKKCPLYARKIAFQNCHIELFDSLSDLINRQQAKIERLEDHNKQLRYDRKQITSEAIKEFAERLKSKKAVHYCKCGESFDYTDTLNAYVDNLVKEMVGDE